MNYDNRKISKQECTKKLLLEMNRGYEPPNLYCGGQILRLLGMRITIGCWDEQVLSCSFITIFMGII